MLPNATNIPSGVIARQTCFDMVFCVVHCLIEQSLSRACHTCRNFLQTLSCSMTSLLASPTEQSHLRLENYFGHCTGCSSLHQGHTSACMTSHLRMPHARFAILLLVSGLRELDASKSRLEQYVYSLCSVIQCKICNSGCSTEALPFVKL